MLENDEDIELCERESLLRLMRSNFNNEQLKVIEMCFFYMIKRIFIHLEKDIDDLCKCYSLEENITFEQLHHVLSECFSEISLLSGMEFHNIKMKESE